MQKRPKFGQLLFFLMAQKHSDMRLQSKTFKVSLNSLQFLFKDISKSQHTLPCRGQQNRQEAHRAVELGGPGLRRQHARTSFSLIHCHCTNATPFATMDHIYKDIGANHDPGTSNRRRNLEPTECSVRLDRVRPSGELGVDTLGEELTACPLAGGHRLRRLRGRTRRTNRPPPNPDRTRRKSGQSGSRLAGGRRTADRTC